MSFFTRIRYLQYVFYTTKRHFSFFKTTLLKFTIWVEADKKAQEEAQEKERWIQIARTKMATNKTYKSLCKPADTIAKSTYKDTYQ